MTDPTASDVDPLQAVLALTPAGREELREPHSGLSLPQRWLLSHLDGHSRLADLVDQPGSPTAERLPRDAAKLVRLGLIAAVGGAGLAASAFGPSTLHGDLTLALPLDDAGTGTPSVAQAPIAAPRSHAPRLVAAAVLMAVGAAATYWAAAGGDRRAPDAAAGRPALAAVDASAAAPSPVSAPPAATSSESTPASEPLQVTAVVRAADPALAPRPRAAVAAASAVARSRSAPDASATGAIGAAAAAPSPAPSLAPSPVQAPPEAAPAPAAPVVTANTASPGPVAPTSGPAQPSVGPATAAGGVAPPAGPPAVAPTAPAPTSTLPPAAAAPPPAAVTTVAALRPVSMVEPSFPREGLGLGSRAVLLQARLTVDASGTVTQVNFVQSNASTRPFERSARAALLQWRFPAGAPDRVYSQQVRFSEE